MRKIEEKKNMLSNLQMKFPRKCSKDLSICLNPAIKIKVFISSICGDNDKFDRIRIKLKQAIEKTNFAEVYCFEQEEPSTLSAGDHYEWALQDSDVVIFLIDNEKGVTPGVQKEIDIARRYNIKSFVYFCDETSSIKTDFEESIQGSNFIKSKTVHKFDEISQNGAQALINDILYIYHYYCKNRLTQFDEKRADGFQVAITSGNEDIQEPINIPKTIFQNIDLCKQYITKMILGNSINRKTEEDISTCAIDEFATIFLSVLFEGVSIKNFNCGMFLDILKEQQMNKQYFLVVSERWKAIQEYFSDNIPLCLQYLESALNLAKDYDQPSWVINDLLVDLRNQQITQDTINNSYKVPSFQTELENQEDNIYYPLLDRFELNIYKKYADDLYKEKLSAPYTTTWGNDLDEYISLLASSFIVAIYNGSLTHILIFYDRIRDFLFFLSCKYNNLNFRIDLLKLTIFSLKSSDIKNLQNVFPETLNNITSKDASYIMEYSNNHTLYYQRFCSQLLAFSVVGCYLNDKDFSAYKQLIINEIDKWLDNKDCVVAIGGYIFKCLDGIAVRLSQNEIANICIKFIDKHFKRWYVDIFKLMGKWANIARMDKEVAHSLIQHIINLIDDPEDKKQVMSAPLFLCEFRMQNKDITEIMDEKIKNQLPDFYNGQYKLNTTDDFQQDYSLIIQNYTEIIRNNNAIQGKNGCYNYYGISYIRTIRVVLADNSYNCASELIDHLIVTLSDTLLISKETINVKLDAISLLTCIILKYPKSYNKNKFVFNTIIDKKELIIDIDNTIISANIDKISLRIGLAFLEMAMGKDVYYELLECMPYIHDSDDTVLAVTEFIKDYLETDQNIIFPQNVDALILQNSLQWLGYSLREIRRNAVNILFALLRNPQNTTTINNALIKMIDSDGTSIKSLILKNISKNDKIDNSIKKYILMKCENDPNYMVRMVCKDVR